MLGSCQAELIAFPFLTGLLERYQRNAIDQMYLILARHLTKSFMVGNCGWKTVMSGGFVTE